MGSGLRIKIQKISDHLISSPCTGNCSMNAAGTLCSSCFRTLDEIMHWSQLSGAQKHAVNKAAAERRSASGQISAR